MPIDRATLFAHLSSDDEQVRLNAAVRLAYLGCADGLDELEVGLTHPEAAIRLVQVPEALALLGDAGLARARHLVTRPGRGRLGAARALAHNGETSGVSGAIADALTDSDLATRDDAACLAGELGPAAIEAYDALACADAPHALTALVAVGGARAIEAVTRALSGGDQRARVTALRALAGLGPAAHNHRPTVTAMLRDTSLSLRERLSAAHTLTRIDRDGDAIAATLIEVLDGADRWLRIGLIRTLAQLGPRYPRLRERSLMWPEWEEDLVVTAPAADVTDQRAVTVLTEQLAHDDSDVRRNAAFALALYGHAAESSAIEPGLRAEVHTLVDRTPRIEADPTGWPWGLHMIVPPVDLDRIAAACERQWATADGGDLSYAIDVPKWQFLHYLVERRGLLLHGSQTAAIEALEPRSRSWGGGRIAGQPGVFAVDHAPFAMYFALIDKTRASNTPNAIYDVRRPDGVRHRCFFLSINSIAIADRPFTNATIYILPPDNFSKLGELTSVVPVKPLARLAIEPADFPLLNRLWGSDLGPLRHQFGARYPFLGDVGAWPTKTLDGR